MNPPAPWTLNGEGGADAMRQLAKGGMTMVVVTHELGFAREVADRACLWIRVGGGDLGSPNLLHQCQGRAQPISQSDVML